MAYQILCTLLSTKFGNSYPTTWNKIKYLDILFREQKKAIYNKMIISKNSQLESCVRTYVCTCTLHVPNVFEIAYRTHIKQDGNTLFQKMIKKTYKRIRVYNSSRRS